MSGKLLPLNPLRLQWPYLVQYNTHGYWEIVDGAGIVVLVVTISLQAHAEAYARELVQQLNSSQYINN